MENPTIWRCISYQKWWFSSHVSFRGCKPLHIWWDIGILQLARSMTETPKGLWPKIEKCLPSPCLGGWWTWSLVFTTLPRSPRSWKMVGFREVPFVFWVSAILQGRIMSSFCGGYVFFQNSHGRAVWCGVLVPYSCCGIMGWILGAPSMQTPKPGRDDVWYDLHTLLMI